MARAGSRSGPGQRVVVIGAIGSGKTTFARALAQRIGAPHHDLEVLRRTPPAGHEHERWEATPPGQDPRVALLQQRAEAATRGERWVVAGNTLPVVQHIVWRRADTVVLLDLPMRVVWKRLLGRTWRRQRGLEDSPPWGHYDTFRQHFLSRQSHLLRSARAKRSHGQRFAQQQADSAWSHLHFVRLRSPSEVDEWLDAASAPPTRPTRYPWTRHSCTSRGGTVEIRELRSDEGEAYRETRLRALREAPDAYRETFAQAAERPLDEWVRAADQMAAEDDRATLVADDGTGFAGMVYLSLDHDDEGVVRSGGMWVEPAARGQGLAAQLLQAAEQWGREREARELRLWVTGNNEVARRMYEREGFQPTGNVEPLRDGSELTTHELAKPIT